MNYIQQLARRTTLLGIAMSMIALWVVADLTILTSHAAAAGQVTTRSLKISSSANGSIGVGNPGDGGNGQKAKYTFSFTTATSNEIRSVLFEACTTPIPGTTCTSPTGMTMANLAGATLTTTGTNFTTGFSVDNTTVLTGSPYNCTGTSPGRTNCLAITRASTTSVASGTAVSVTFTVDATHYITNPTTDNSTFFIRMTTYDDTAYATTIDQGTVANSTAQQIDITAKVQETLNFSVGSTITAPGSSCTAYGDSGALNLGDANGVLSFAQAYDAHSYFRVSTNAANGTIVYFSGDTLKSGTNSITGLSNASTASTSGTQQFGLAIDSSDASYSFASLAADTPYDGGAGTLTNGTGTARFAFDTASVSTPRQIAHATGTILCDTGAVRYLGNISTTTPPGIYTTTITYLATPTY